MQQAVESIEQTRRRGIRRTALVLGGVAMVFFTLSIVQMLMLK